MSERLMPGKVLAACSCYCRLLASLGPQARGIQQELVLRTAWSSETEVIVVHPSDQGQELRTQLKEVSINSRTTSKLGTQDEQQWFLAAWVYRLVLCQFDTS